MKYFFIICLFLVMYALGAVSHETDIQRECAETGQSNKSAWLGELTCSPAQEQKE